MGLEATPSSISSCLEVHVFGVPGEGRGLPPGRLPALRALSVHAVRNRGPLPAELSALTQLTRLQVEGEAVRVRTIEEWREHYDRTRDDSGSEPDSDELEQEAVEGFMEAYAPIALPGPGFCLPRLGELSLLSCCLRQVPKFVAGAAAGVMPGGGAAAGQRLLDAALCEGPLRRRTRRPEETASAAVVPA